MNAPVLTYSFDAGISRGFADLATVRLLRAVTTDEGVGIPAGTCGTVVAVYADGAAYEVEFEAGLATVEAGALEAR
ncbi:DUF4926 domain-containing protein [Lichenibacterium dinghuense]|uniref:DUF4926 domain-containing protein n=1 Tax=Lichenibacterium dinghuense TaxID=2895977 RepID=UPI001F224CF4|nr:DUF4926 domain-containing protein [Lichenibacterium sp. 6Y81]